MSIPNDDEWFYDGYECWFKDRYDETDPPDPVYLWQIIDEFGHLYNSGERQFPDWVITYLCRTAKNIMGIDNPNKKFPNEIVQALGSPKQWTISKIRNEDRNDRILGTIERYRKQGKKFEECYTLAAKEALAAKEPLAISTIRVMHKKYRSRENKDMQKVNPES